MLNRNRLNTERARRWITLILLLASAGALVVLGGRSGLFRPLISLIMVPTSPLAGLLTGGAERVAGLAENPADYEDVLARSQELEAELAALQVELVRLQAIEEDYLSLSALVAYQSQRPDQNLVAANVIARESSGYLRWVILNRGARDGIREGNPVITDRGLLGRVEAVAANAAWVRLLNDSASAVNVQTQTTGAEGTVVGQLQGNLRMTLIPQTAVIQTGDLVLTSGLGGSFPADLLVGQVSSVRDLQGALFQEAEIRPIVDFDNIDLVAVIVEFVPIDTTVFDDVIEEQAP